LQTRNPSEFWVNKQKLPPPPLKRVTLSSAAKNNSSRLGGGSVPQLRSRHFSNLKKCKRQNFWEVVAVGIFVRVLLQQLGGANDPILAGLMLMHWLMNCCIECALL